MADLEKILVIQGLELLTTFSGAVGKCTDTRSFQKNRQIAFKRMAETKEFKIWHKIECAKRLNLLVDLEEKLDTLMLDSNLKIEILK